ncbi:MAG: hypothetical protein CM15mP74_12360 [Halieaceae bacterium]|nr:MAG: hypothetical protein CM15mP74_12360 [Halieaceae bacterium]
MYNEQMTSAYEQAKSFLILHYVTSERRDTSSGETVPTSTSLTCLKRGWKCLANWRCFIPDGELFSQGSWLAVMMGQGFWLPVPVPSRILPKRAW